MKKCLNHCRFCKGDGCILFPNLVISTSTVFPERCRHYEKKVVDSKSAEDSFLERQIQDKKNRISFFREVYAGMESYGDLSEVEDFQLLTLEKRSFLERSNIDVLQSLDN